MLASEKVQMAREVSVELNQSMSSIDMQDSPCDEAVLPQI
jgi:hypothetical protein